MQRSGNSAAPPNVAPDRAPPCGPAPQSLSKYAAAPPAAPPCFAERPVTAPALPVYSWGASDSSDDNNTGPGSSNTRDEKRRSLFARGRSGLRAGNKCFGARGQGSGRLESQPGARHALELDYERDALRARRRRPRDPASTRSEERRVGKECRSRWSP